MHGEVVGNLKFIAKIEVMHVHPKCTIANNSAHHIVLRPPSLKAQGGKGENEFANLMAI